MAIRVLLVDDNAAHLDLLRLLMELDDDLDLVGTAPDGQDGITLARELQPDLIVSDIEMPRLDGLSAVPGYREAAPEATVVLMSSREPVEAAAAAREANVDAYIDKGIGVDTLLDMLKDAVARKADRAQPPVIDLRAEDRDPVARSDVNDR